MFTYLHRVAWKDDHRAMRLLFQSEESGIEAVVAQDTAADQEEIDTGFLAGFRQYIEASVVRLIGIHQDGEQLPVFPPGTFEQFEDPLFHTLWLKYENAYCHAGWAV